MTNLLLHCGAHEVTQDQLAKVATPKATRSWTPIPHIDLLDAVRREITHSGLAIEEQTLGLSQPKNSIPGARFFGLLQVSASDSNPTAKGWAMIIGVRNSHDRRFPAGLCLGSRVIVCDNLAFSAEVVVARRHTRFIRRDLPPLITDAVGQLDELRHRQTDRIEAYRAATITDEQFHDLAVRAIDAGVVAPSKLPRVLDEYRFPQHAPFEPRVVWSAFNAFTKILKHYNIQNLPRRTQALHGLCDLLAHVN